MKKVCLVIMCLMLVVPLLSGCAHTKKAKESLIKYQRKLSQYTQYEQSADISSVKRSGIVDLSDGKQMRYDMRFSPKDPSFDVQLKDPYSY